MATDLETKLAEALQSIKLWVCGDRHPNWASDWATICSRQNIADLCDGALAAYDAQKAAELKPWTCVDCGCQNPGGCAYCQHGRCSLGDGT